MDLAFWRQRWEARQIAFHEGKPNTLLSQHAHAFDGRKRVLVPLAGKSVDMMFLAGLGLEVVGVEGVESACREFFDDNGVPLVIEERDGFRAFCGGGVTLLCGDMFDVTRARVGTFDAVYDRAALVALEPSTRARYVETIRAVLEPGARMAIVTFHYDQAKVAGPPWSIPPELVRSLYEGFVVEEVVTHDVPRGPKFVDAGVTQVEESLVIASLA